MSLLEIWVKCLHPGHSGCPVKATGKLILSRYIWTFGTGRSSGAIIATLKCLPTAEAKKRAYVPDPEPHKGKSCRYKILIFAFNKIQLARSIMDCVKDLQISE